MSLRGINKWWQQSYWHSTRNWNRRCIERGYPLAVLPEPPLRKKVKNVTRLLFRDFRWWLAMKIAPELREELELR